MLSTILLFAKVKFSFYMLIYRISINIYKRYPSCCHRLASSRYSC